MRALWGQEQATYAGEFTSFTDCICRPQPVSGSVPIHIGGHSDVAARRAGRIGDGFFPANGSHRRLGELFGLVRSTAEGAGRDPAAIEFTSGGNGVLGPGALEEAAALAELGVHRIVVPAFPFWKDTQEALARYGDEVIARV
jgi:alkanesulfonate monooxygenase SsuD/methylene tetrahydromethanopterin reductase-like flavin-dependent oxidoreductase (luciferase family)